MSKEIAELRAELIERLRREAAYVQSATHDARMEKLVMVHQTILAVDAVIAAGGVDKPDPDAPLAAYFPYKD